MEDFWATGTEKSWKALSEFPARLRSMAEEVKQVSAGPYFNPEIWISAQTLTAKFIKRSLRELPTSLGVYATHVEVIIGKLPALNTGHSPKRKLHEPWTSWLSDFVKALTGRYRDRQVADLLNSAADALHEDFEIDEFGLAQARSHRKQSLNRQL